MEEIVYLNGALVQRSQARVSVYDLGFLYGYGLFETMRAYNGKIFLLERHLKRLLQGAEVIGLNSRLLKVDLGKACNDTVKANGLKNARIRLTVFRGEMDPFPGSDVNVVPTVLVTAKSYSPPASEVYQRGFQMRISSYRRDSKSPLRSRLTRSRAKENSASGLRTWLSTLGARSCQLGRGKRSGNDTMEPRGEASRYFSPRRRVPSKPFPWCAVGRSLKLDPAANCESAFCRFATAHQKLERPRHTLRE